MYRNRQKARTMKRKRDRVREIRPAVVLFDEPWSTGWDVRRERQAWEAAAGFLRSQMAGSLAAFSAVLEVSDAS